MRRPFWIIVLEDTSASCAALRFSLFCRWRSASASACNSVVGISIMLGLRSLREASARITPVAVRSRQCIAVGTDLAFVLETMSDSTCIAQVFIYFFLCLIQNGLQLSG